MHRLTRLVRRRVELDERSGLGNEVSAWDEGEILL